MLQRLGGVQLDTISVLARSHELVAYARHGAIRRESIEQAYWGPRSATFEYWSHAACTCGRPMGSSVGPVVPRGGAGTSWKTRPAAVPLSWRASGPRDR